jgi:hydroxymethylglutaryl-CoA synthase
LKFTKEQPVFDGQYSINVTWTELRNALFFFQKLKQTNQPIYTLKSIIMHLPYAFQGRRMLSEIYALDSGTK